MNLLPALNLFVSLLWVVLHHPPTMRDCPASIQLYKYEMPARAYCHGSGRPLGAPRSVSEVGPPRASLKQPEAEITRGFAGEDCRPKISSLTRVPILSRSSLQYDQLAVYCLARARAAGFTYHAAPQCLPRSVCEPILSLSHYSWSGAS